MGMSCCTVGLSLIAVSPTVSRQALEQVFGSFSASSLSLTPVQPQRQTAALWGCSSHTWGRQEQMPGPSSSHVNALRPVCSCLSVLQLPLGGHQRCMVHHEEQPLMQPLQRPRSLSALGSDSCDPVHAGAGPTPAPGKNAVPPYGSALSSAAGSPVQPLSAESSAADAPGRSPGLSVTRQRRSLVDRNAAPPSQGLSKSSSRALRASTFTLPAGPLLGRKGANR